MNRHRYLIIGLGIIIVLSVVFFSFRIFNTFDSHADLYMKTKIFTETLVHIADEYVDDIDFDFLVDKAINAMIEELDPHSNYVPANAYGRMTDQFMGYQGIGITFKMVDDKITVMRVLRNGPAERAGIQLGDHIIKIENDDVLGIEQDVVPTLLKGPIGTTVSVTIERPGLNEQFDVIFTRGQAFLESIRYYFMIDDTTGYVQLERFSRTSNQELQRVLRRLEGQGMKRLVFDLRNNTGGLLPQALEVSDSFLDGNKLIVKTVGRHPTANSEFNSTDSPTDVRIPMIVLINERSASASEIASGALQDWDRALILGKTSFGKGLVQSQIKFDDKSALLLTIGRWYTPLGRLIQKEYDNKSRQQYRSDATDDSLNSARIASEDRPTFTSPKGRMVYGGGGITPDHELDSDISASEFVFRIRSLPNRDPIFNFSQIYALEHQNTWDNVDTFIEEFTFINDDIERFKSFLADGDFEYTEEDFTEEVIRELELWVRVQTGEFLWGDEGRIKSFSVIDNVLWNSLEYFPEAENLINN